MKESARSSNTAVTRFRFKRRSWVLCMILSSRGRSGILSRFQGCPCFVGTRLLPATSVIESSKERGSVDKVIVVKR
jgi:hypothetical protein